MCTITLLKNVPYTPGGHKGEGKNGGTVADRAVLVKRSLQQIFKNLEENLKGGASSDRYLTVSLMKYMWTNDYEW